VLDDIPKLSEEQTDMIESLKKNVCKRADTFRVQVRRRLGPNAIQYLFEKERIGALGLASGALIGTLL